MWIDNGDGILGFCDTIYMEKTTSPPTEVLVLHVEAYAPGANIVCSLIVWIVESTAKTFTFHCQAPGLVNVTLTVYAPDTNPPTSPEYDDTVTSAPKTIEQRLKPVGCMLDVYTEKGGIGLGEWSDAFAPQENVTIYAKLTYNDDPVCNKPVAFEVKDNEGNAVTFRTAFTNASGIAETWFRIPWPCNKTFTAKFENWTIYASVSINEVKQYDICPFRYGWIVQVHGGELGIITMGDIDETHVHKGENLEVKIVLNNISFTSKNVTVTAVLYDECGVPVLVYVWDDVLVDPSPGSETTAQTLTVPKWAYKGWGTLYVNIYTRRPQNCGVPVAPEAEKAIYLDSPLP